MGNYAFNQVFIEVRYNSALLFNDMGKIQLITDDLSTEFPTYTYDQNQQALILNNIDKQYNANIFSNRFILEFDKLTNFEETKEITEIFVKSIVKNLNIKTFNRMGMRTFRGIKKKNIGEANSFIRKNLFKCDDVLLSRLGNNINDLGISFSFSSDLYKVIMNIKSGTIQTLEVKDSVMIKNEILHEVIIDSDVFIDGKIEAVDEVSSKFINDVININNNKIDNFIKDVSIY